MSISEILNNDSLFKLIKLTDPLTRTQIALTCSLLLKFIENDDVWVMDYHDLQNKHILYDNMKLKWSNDSNKIVSYYVDKNNNYLNYDGNYHLYYVMDENRCPRLIKIPYGEEQKNKFLQNCAQINYKLLQVHNFNNMHTFIIMRALINIYYCFGMIFMKQNKLDFVSNPILLLNMSTLRANIDEFNNKKNPRQNKAEKIFHIPWGFKFATNLTELIIMGHRIREYPKYLCYLPKLSYINLHKNDLETLPEEFSQLSSLKRLHIGGNYFASVPHMLSNMPNLTTLDFSECKNIVFPSFADIIHLKKINFSRTNIRIIPMHGILQLPKLEELYLHSGDPASIDIYNEYKILKNNLKHNLEVILC